MTMLASWVGIDTHGICSAYIVSDSRFSWNKNQYFDYGKKVFASNNYPELFGYAGDVLFPSTVLSQIIEMIDFGLLFTPEMSCKKKNELIFDVLKKSLSHYPIVHLSEPFDIIHISRDTIVSGYPNFYCYHMSWNKTNVWSNEEVIFPDSSGLLYVLGSGSSEFKENYYNKYQKGYIPDTSRNVFHCFVYTLDNIKDNLCGGAPQLIGLYRKANTFGKCFGVIYKNKRYFLGSEINDYLSLDSIDWRNELFELYDGKTMQKIPCAQRQPDLLRRDK